MKQKLPHINNWLRPFSWVYGTVVYLRNKFFDWGILKQKSYDIPIICVGNIAVGGTGKTPHVEYLIRLLNNQFKVAVLSRGYKRKTSGFILANETSTSRDIGDESFQIKRKFPHILVAVDAKRNRGIERLLNFDENIRPDVILLDDAFQHRYVKPSLSILLSDYSCPFYDDILLPAGRLREPSLHSEHANIIIVSKCPHDIKPIDLRIVSHEINPYPYQNLLFTYLKYKKLTPVFHGVGPNLPLDSLSNKEVLLIVGIANPSSLIQKIKNYTSSVETIVFADHHMFKERDIKKIEAKFSEMNKDQRIVVTTEKDATRLLIKKNFSEDLKNALYYLPIEISFIGDDAKELFNKKIINHVERNTRDCELY